MINTLTLTRLSRHETTDDIVCPLFDLKFQKLHQKLHPTQSYVSSQANLNSPTRNGKMAHYLHNLHYPSYCRAFTLAHLNVFPSRVLSGLYTKGYVYVS